MDNWAQSLIKTVSNAGKLSEAMAPPVDKRQNLKDAAEKLRSAIHSDSAADSDVDEAHQNYMKAYSAMSGK